MPDPDRSLIHDYCLLRKQLLQQLEATPSLLGQGRHAASRIMGLLLWTDVLEKIDVLLLEIRHLQTNIVFDLQSGHLLAALRYEESYIFGGAGGRRSDPSNPDWLDLFGLTDLGPEDLPELAAAWVLPLSTDADQLEDRGIVARLAKAKSTDPVRKQGRDTVQPGGQSSRLVLDLDERRRLIKDLEESVASNWRGGQWGQESRRDYDLFDGLQRLKRNLVLFKLQLCWWGSWAFQMLRSPGGVRFQGSNAAEAAAADEDFLRHPSGTESDTSFRTEMAEDPDRLGSLQMRPTEPTERLAHFLTVRAALLRQVQDAVQRLGDFQAQAERTFDLARDTDRRPVHGRRRQQGIYNAFLGARATDLVHDIESLLDHLGVDDPHRGRRSPAIVTHRWEHHYSSHSYAFVDSVARPSAVDHPAAIAIDIISSNYWMPDRPDLVSAIAHEAAHTALRRRLSPYLSSAWKQSDGALARLMRLVSHCMSLFQLEPEEHLPPYYSVPYTSNEIAADLIATSIYGHSFVFALFQEIIGLGLAPLYQMPNRQVDLSYASILWRQRHARGEIDISWYCRLRVVSGFMRAVELPEEESALTRTLLDGVESITDGLQTYLDELFKGDEHQYPLYWRRLTHRLVEIVEDSEMVGAVRQWRAERRTDRRSHRQKGNSSEATLVRSAERSYRPLPVDVSRFLKRVLISRKATTPMRALHEELAGVQSTLLAVDRLFLRSDVASLDSESPNSTGDFRANDFALAKLYHYFFARLYLGFVPDRFAVCDRKNDEDIIDRMPLFAHVHDVPWQGAILRAVDYLQCLPLMGPSANDGQAAREEQAGPDDFDTIAARTRKREILALCNDFAPGRELYQIALEFDVLNTKRAHDRLLIAMRLVEKMIPDSMPESQGLSEAPSEFRREALDGASPASWIGDFDKWVGSEPTPEESERLAGCLLTLDQRYRRYARLRRRWADALLHRAAEGLARRTGAKSLISLSYAMRAMPLKVRSKRDARLPPAYLLNLVQGKKLQGLVDVLGGHLRLVPSLLPLFAHISEQGREQRSIGRQRVLGAIDNWRYTSHYGRGADVLGSLRYEELSFLTLAATSGSEDLFGVLNQTRKKLRPGFGERSRGMIYSTLGRFDILATMNAGPMTRCPLPLLDPGRDTLDSEPSFASGPGPSSGAQEQFFRVFERRELGLRIALTRGDAEEVRELIQARSNNGDYQPPDIVAMLAIVLMQRDARLEFLSRLLAASGLDPAPSWHSLQKIDDVRRDQLRSLEGLGGLTGKRAFFHPHDIGYLAEGAGDVLLVFRNLIGGAESRLRNIFWLATALYEDFMVERTELILFPPALEAVYHHPEQFNVHQGIRLQQSRDLERSFARVAGVLRARIGDVIERCRDADDKAMLSNYTEQPRLSVIPGRADYIIQHNSEWLRSFWRACKGVEAVDNGKIESGAFGGDQLFRALNSLVLGSGVVDSIRTTISVGTSVTAEELPCNG